MLSQGACVAKNIGIRMSRPGAAPYVLMNPGRTFGALGSAFEKSNAFMPSLDQRDGVFLDPLSSEGIAAAAAPAPDAFGMDDEDESDPPPQPPDQLRLQSRRGLHQALQGQSRFDTAETRRMEQFQQTAFELNQVAGRFYAHCALEMPTVSVLALR